MIDSWLTMGRVCAWAAPCCCGSIPMIASQTLAANEQDVSVCVFWLVGGNGDRSSFCIYSLWELGAVT